MNVENLFIQSGDQQSVIAIVGDYLAGEINAEQPNWALPSSHEPLLARETKRKVAISPLRDGWIAVIESKEVVDFGMAKAIADHLQGMAVIVQSSDVTGTLGTLIYANGQVLESHLDEEAVDPMNDARAFLRKYGIPFDLMMFREVVRPSQGWSIKKR